MNRHLLSLLNGHKLAENTNDSWEHSDPPPVSLKQLSKNLSFLEQQYHTKARQKRQQSQKENFKSSSVPIRKQHQKQNSSLRQIFSSNYAVDISIKKKKRSTSLVKDLNIFVNKQEDSASLDKKRVGKEFSQMRGLFPLEGKEQSCFLHKHKVLNITRALNLTKIRNKKSHKVFYTALENQVSKFEHIKTSAFQDLQKIQ